MIYGYIRVSTDHQTVENQRFEIENYTKKNNLKIDKYFEETISGTKDLSKRALGKLIKKLKKGDILIASELSRLGRNFYMIIEILNICVFKQVQIITIKENFTTKDDIETKVIAFAFSLCAEIERELISQRTKEALQRLKNEGVKLGRPKGSKNKSNVYERNLDRINAMKSKGRSISHIAKRIGVHRNTLYKYMNENKKN